MRSHAFIRFRFVLQGRSKEMNLKLLEVRPPYPNCICFCTQSPIRSQVQLSHTVQLSGTNAQAAVPSQGDLSCLACCGARTRTHHETDFFDDAMQTASPAPCAATRVPKRPILGHVHRTVAVRNGLVPKKDFGSHAVYGESAVCWHGNVSTARGLT